MAGDPAKVAAALAKSEATINAGLVDPEFDRAALGAQQAAEAAAIGDAVGDDEDNDVPDYDPDDIEAREAYADAESTRPAVDPTRADGTRDTSTSADASTQSTSPQLTAQQLERLQYADYVDNLLKNDPAAVAKFAFERLTPEQKQALLGTPTPEPDAYAVSPEDLATFTVAERIAYDNRQHIVSIPKRFQTMEASLQQQQQKTENALVWRDYQLERQQAQISALMELLDVQLPDTPDSEVDALMRGPNAISLKAAVAATVGKKAKDAVALKKAQNKPTPRTPSSAGGRGDGRAPLDDNADLLAQMLHDRGLEPTKELADRVRNYRSGRRG